MEKYENVPYADKVVDNGVIYIESIFQFTGGCEELMPFLLVCKKHKCCVTFLNENIIIDNSQKDDMRQEMMLAMYASIAKDPKICQDYIRYLSKTLTGEYKLGEPGFKG